MPKYPFDHIEPKWQAYWDDNATFRVTEDPSIPRDRRRYVLDMFPYPSAAGLHVGHPEGYTATDIYCRYLRMNGYHVLHPMGFDSFGLPAENYAIQTGTHPRVTTEANIDRFREQIKSLGFSYDWEREVSTHKPDYYRWTQWIFLQLWNRGLAYVAEVPVWYCDALGTVLANEEVLATPEGPRSERGNHPVERRPLRQWMLRITEYAERLLAGLDELDWPESTKAMQRNWIGRSEGAVVSFEIVCGRAETEAEAESIEVFTTRPDTLFGATYLVLAPEHPLVPLVTMPDRGRSVQAYVEQARSKSDLERTDLAKEKTGEFTGCYARNPVNGVDIPIWISDYVLMGYGTGAIMAVPGHDQRDWEFATAFDLPVLRVVAASADGADNPLTEAEPAPGTAVHSGQFSGLPTAEAKEQIVAWLSQHGVGRSEVTFKLRDWIFSRQRYWGEPIPIVNCNGEFTPVAPEDLPVTLPEVESYKPTGTGESPLAAIESWVSHRCADEPETMGRRETNTMPQWAGSCWYYLRFIDPHNDSAFANRDKLDYWLPVDLYVGGQEHAVLHLLYARFWHMVLFDAGLVSTPEPFQRLVHQGMILGEGGVKMSKSLGNVINPDDIVRDYGADTMRVYEMFMGPLQQEKPWSTEGISGAHRFLDRVWRLGERQVTSDPPPQEIVRTLHKTIKKVGEDTAALQFNTAISQLMILVNELFKSPTLPRETWSAFVRLLAPYAPHLAEELWEQLGEDSPVSLAQWPDFDPQLVVDDTVTIVFQVNGKVRAKQTVARGTAGPALEKMARANPRISEYLAGSEVVKCVIVADKLVNFVVR